MLKPTVDEIILAIFGVTVIVADAIDYAGWEFFVLGGLMIVASAFSYIFRLHKNKK